MANKIDKSQEECDTAIRTALGLAAEAYEESLDDHKYQEDTIGLYVEGKLPKARPTIKWMTYWVSNTNFSKLRQNDCGKGEIEIQVSVTLGLVKRDDSASSSDDDNAY